MVGHDGQRGWVYYLAVGENQRGTGLGRHMMAAAENWLREHGAVLSVSQGDDLRGMTRDDRLSRRTD